MIIHITHRKHQQHQIKNKERQGHEIGIVQNGRVNVQNGDTQESGHK